MDMGLVGKRVLVIEPSTGLEATVEVFAAEGEAAFVQGRDEACAQALAESIFDAGGRVQCDRVQRFIRRGGDRGATLLVDCMKQSASAASSGCLASLSRSQDGSRGPTEPS